MKKEDSETAGYLRVIRESRKDRPKLPICDRCGVVVDIYHIPDVGWRCLPCIWKEVVELRVEFVKVRAELEQFKQAYGDCLGLRNDSRRLTND